MENKSLRKKNYLPGLFLLFLLFITTSTGIYLISNYRLNIIMTIYVLLIVPISILILIISRKYFGKIENEGYVTQETNESILSAVTNPMMIINADYSIKDLNKCAEQLLTTGSANLIDKNFFEINIPWDNSAMREIFETIKKTGKPLQSHETAFGTERIMGVSVYPINDSKGEVSGFLLTGSDITQKKINENKKNIEQKLISLGDLSAGVAHEINTPSHYIISNLDFLKKSIEDIHALYTKLQDLLKSFKNGNTLKKKQLNGLYEHITGKEIDYLFSEIPGTINQSLEGMDHITKIVKSMKSFAQPDTGKKIQVNINNLIEDIITISRNEWKYSAEMKSDYDHDLQDIRCNPAEINQSLLELIINSSYAISDKVKTGVYRKGEIEIITYREKGMAVIKVKDNGIGIPGNLKNRVFDPFFSTRDVGKGTGSGLSYVYASIVRNHGGSIEINSKDNIGTEFIIKLPVSEQIN